MSTFLAGGPAVPDLLDPFIRRCLRLTAFGLVQTPSCPDLSASVLDEWASTERFMEAQIAPLITAYTVEFVQFAVRKNSRNSAFATVIIISKVTTRSLTNPDC